MLFLTVFYYDMSFIFFIGFRYPLRNIHRLHSLRLKYSDFVEIRVWAIPGWTVFEVCQNLRLYSLYLVMSVRFWWNLKQLVWRIVIKTQLFSLFKIFTSMTSYRVSKGGGVLMRHSHLFLSAFISSNRDILYFD